MNDLAKAAGLLLVVAAATTLTGCSVSDAYARPAGPIPTTEPGAVQVYLNECGMELESEPRTFTLTCADAGKTLQGLTWKDWGSPDATATGREVVNLCEPDCAAGRTASFPVDVAASQLTVGRSASAYTQLTVTARDSTPKGVRPHEVFNLDSPDTKHAPR